MLKLALYILGTFLSFYGNTVIQNSWNIKIFSHDPLSLFLRCIIVAIERLILPNLDSKIGLFIEPCFVMDLKMSSHYS